MKTELSADRPTLLLRQYYREDMRFWAITWREWRRDQCTNMFAKMALQYAKRCRDLSNLLEV